MSNINCVVLSGNLTREPELRPAGDNFVLAFGIAVNDRTRNPQTGEYENYPNYINCSLYGSRAKGLQPYLHKGQKVGIQGRLHYHQYQDKEGHNHNTISVYVDNLDFMSSRSDEQESSGAAPVETSASRPHPGQGASRTSAPLPQISDDDYEEGGIPF